MIEVINELGAKNNDFVQTCVFCLGCIAQRTPAGKLTILSEILKIVASILQNVSTFTNDKNEVHTCVDNAVSCLGKCIFFHGSTNTNLIDAPIIRAFLQKLPLIVDCEEGQVVHN